MRARGGKRPVLTIPDIRVTAGAPIRDPRLDAIDLRGRLRAIKIRVLDSYGESLDRSKHVRVLLDDPTPDAELTAFDSRLGVVTIFTGERSVDLLIGARGYRPRRIRAVDADTSVRLEPFPEITLRVGQSLRTLPENVRLLLIVLPQQTRERDRRRFRTPFERGSVEALLQPGSMMKAVAPDGSATLVVRGNGSHRAYAFLQRKGSRRPWPVTGIQPAEIDVKIGLGVFDVSLPQGALARTLEKIAAH